MRRRERKKLKKGQQNEETKDGSDENNDKSSPFLKPKKPTLIKTINFDKKECETTLETFLNDVYENYKLKP